MLDIKIIKNKIYELHELGLSQRKIAKQLNISQTTVYKYLHLNPNIEIKKPITYEFNENIFNVIDTQEKSYWLGFLSGDGYVKNKNNVMRLKLQISDMDHIEKFKTFLTSNHPIRVEKTKDRKYSVITIHSYDMCNDLIKHGCINKKSLILKLPPFVPDSLINHFIRGYFDANGWVSNKCYKNSLKIGWVGTYEMLEWIALNIQKQYNIKSNKIFKRGNICLLQYGSAYHISPVYNFMYKQSIIHLDRKLNIFKNFLKI